MRRFRTWLSLATALVLAAPVITISPTATHAQDDTPATVVAAGLINPRGFTWGDDGGTLFVAEGGTGGTTPGDPETPPPVGPVTGGTSARISWIAEGCPATLVDELPSYNTALGEASGVAD